MPPHYSKSNQSTQATTRATTQEVTKAATTATPSSVSSLWIAAWPVRPMLYRREQAPSRASSRRLRSLRQWESKSRLATRSIWTDRRLRDHRNASTPCLNQCHRRNRMRSRKTRWLMKTPHTRPVTSSFLPSKRSSKSSVTDLLGTSPLLTPN